MNTIYKATNKITGKSYIGFDSAWPSRKERHQENATYNREGKFYDSIRKHGWESFEWSIIYQSPDKYHTLNIMEPHFIKEYDTFNTGYNMTEGGEGCFGATTNKLWINDGVNHKRIEKTEPIPEGWSVGRIGLKRQKKMTDESKELIGQKNKGKLINGKNPAAKKVFYQGNEYYSLRNASEKTGISVYLIRKSCTFI